MCSHCNLWHDRGAFDYYGRPFKQDAGNHSGCTDYTSQQGGDRGTQPGYNHEEKLQLKKGVCHLWRCDIGGHKFCPKNNFPRSGCKKGNPAPDGNDKCTLHSRGEVGVDSKQCTQRVKCPHCGCLTMSVEEAGATLHNVVDRILVILRALVHLHLQPLSLTHAATHVCSLSQL